MRYRDVSFYSCAVFFLYCSLLYYLYTRWSHFCWYQFALVPETIILIVGSINMSVLLYGTIYYRDQIIDENLETAQVKIMNLLTAGGTLPTVLVIIPTYKEGVVVLRRTLRAVQKIDYPPEKLTVVVGDDGESDEVRDFIRDEFPGFACTRRKIIRGHAKAGNINDILFSGYDPDHFSYDAEWPRCVEHGGDMVLVLDCDMAPQADILQNLVPMFYDLREDVPLKNPSMCFVQSPQRFCNVGIDLLGQNYYFFYDVVLRAYSVYSCGVPCCGTNVLFDRDLFMKIGGMQYGSITEDFNTSLVFHASGYKSRYCSKTTAVGFAPTTLLDFFYQRERWAIGGLEIVFCRKFWKLFRDLPPMYRWIYFFSGASPILSLLFAILVLGPVIDLFRTGVFLCSLTSHEYTTSFLPYISVYLLGMLYLHSRLPLAMFFLSLQETLFMVPFNMYFLCSYLGKVLGISRITFKITPKRASTRKRRVDQHVMISIFRTLGVLLPFLLFYAAGVYGMIDSLFRSHWKVSPEKWVDVGWLGCIGLQLINPLLYAILNS